MPLEVWVRDSFYFPATHPFPTSIRNSMELQHYLVYWQLSECQGAPRFPLGLFMALLHRPDDKAASRCPLAEFSFGEFSEPFAYPLAYRAWQREIVAYKIRWVGWVNTVEFRWSTCLLEWTQI